MVFRFFLLGKAIQIGKEVTSMNYVEQLLIEVDQLNTCPGFELQNHLHRSSKCMSCIKGKQITCINCRFLKNNIDKRSPKKTLRNRYTLKINRNLSKKVFYFYFKGST